MSKKKPAKEKSTKTTRTARPAGKTGSRKTTAKPASGKAAKKAATAKKKTAAAATKKSARGKKPVKKGPIKGRPSRTATKKTQAKKTAESTTSRVTTKRKGVRRATTTSGIRSNRTTRKLGRSQIPIDAPLDIVFQNDQTAQEAFVFLAIHTIRELEQFEPDELVRRLTSPAKQTVGRIRKILAMNNRSLHDDEAFAMEFKERLAQTHAMK